MRSFQVKEALEQEGGQRQQSTYHCVDAEKRWPNQRTGRLIKSSECSVRKHLEIYSDGKVRPNNRRVGIPTKTIWTPFNWQ